MCGEGRGCSGREIAKSNPANIMTCVSCVSATQYRRIFTVFTDSKKAAKDIENWAH